MDGLEIELCEQIATLRRTTFSSHPFFESSLKPVTSAPAAVAEAAGYLLTQLSPTASSL